MDVMMLFKATSCYCDFRSKIRAFDSENTWRLLTCEDTAALIIALTASVSATKAPTKNRILRSSELPSETVLACSNYQHTVYQSDALTAFFEQGIIAMAETRQAFSKSKPR